MRAERTRAIRLKSQYAHYHRMDHVSWSGVSALCVAATLLVVLLTLFSRFRTPVSWFRFSARILRTISGMSTSSVARRPRGRVARPRLRCNRPFRACIRATAPRFWFQHLPGTCMCVTATPFRPTCADRGSACLAGSVRRTAGRAAGIASHRAWAGGGQLPLHTPVGDDMGGAGVGCRLARAGGRKRRRHGCSHIDCGRRRCGAICSREATTHTGVLPRL
jgi:hypothetical protein